MSFLDLKIETFGLEIGDSCIKAVQIKRKKKGFFLAFLNETELAPGIVENGEIKRRDSLVSAIREVCLSAEGKKPDTKYVAASLPEEESFVQVIQMPKMTASELRTAIIFEAENYIPLPIAQTYLDFAVIPPAKENTESPSHLDILIAAMPKEIVDSYVFCIKKAGFVPVAFEIESQAIARALVKNGTTEYPAALLSIGKTSADFAIFSGASVRFTCSIPISGQQPFEDLSLQAKKYIDFYEEHDMHEHSLKTPSVKKIILSGAGIASKKLPDYFARKTGVKTEFGDVFSNMPGEKNGFESLANPLAFSTAIGLALREKFYD